MNELALFAGAGGGILGGKLLGWRTVCAVEIDPYCREVLLRRQEEGHLPAFPVWDDARTFDGRPWRGKVDVVSAGFPCQPFSVAGRRAGAVDERNLWPDTLRILCEVRPQYALLENVPGLLSIHGPDGEPYFGTILGELAASGFDARWCVLGADDVGANHRRKRLWVLAYASGNGERRLPVRQRGSCETSSFAAGGREEVPYANGSRPSDVQGGCPAAKASGGRELGAGSWWNFEPDVGRVANGVAYRVDRLKALGNGQVPAVASAAWSMLKGDMGGGEK